MFDKLFDFGTDDAPREEYNPDGLTKLQRQRPNGQLTTHDPPDAPLARSAVDRQPNTGRFVSRERDPVPLLRDADGTLERDEFAVGVSDPDDALELFDESGGDRR